MNTSNFLNLLEVENVCSAVADVMGIVKYSRRSACISENIAFPIDVVFISSHMVLIVVTSLIASELSLFETFNNYAYGSIESCDINFSIYTEI